MRAAASPSLAPAASAARASRPISTAPEVAILAPALGHEAYGTRFLPARSILPVSLSWDHRVVDGVAAARFLGHTIAATLADFRRAAL